MDTEGLTQDQQPLQSEHTKNQSDSQQQKSTITDTPK